MACIYNPVHRFLGRIYQAFYRANFSKGWTVFKEAEIQDFKLLQSFLDPAAKGVSMNNITFRKPTQIYHSDSSEFGMGGYNITSGVAWHFELPVDCRLQTSMNSLEFITCIINIWVDIFHGILESESCLLSQTNSSAASGWLCKSNFTDKIDETIQLATNRKLADILMESESNLYSQWFPGDKNSISDSLSHDFHIPITNLSFLLESHFLEQAPFGLKILPLPLDIVSWLICLLLSQLQKELWLEEQVQSKFALGLDSSYIYNPLDCSQTHILTTSPRTKRSKFSEPSPNPSEKVDYVLENLINPSNPTWSEPPWIAWLRPSSWLVNQTQDWTTKKDLLSFFNDSSEDTLLQMTP
jgi:hypothetical protein